MIVKSVGTCSQNYKGEHMVNISKKKKIMLYLYNLDEIEL